MQWRTDEGGSVFFSKNKTTHIFNFVYFSVHNVFILVHFNIPGVNWDLNVSSTDLSAECEQELLDFVNFKSSSN